MSVSNSSSDSNTESFDLIDDFGSDQKKDKILISPSLSFTSTDNIEDLNEEFRMEPELREKSFVENQAIEDNKNLPHQTIPNISQRISDTGDSLANFDNQKLQEQLNMQIQSNQQHLQTTHQLSQQQQQQSNPQQPSSLQLNPQNLGEQQNQSSAPEILQQQLNPQLFNQISQKFAQLQLNQSQLQPSQQNQPPTQPAISPQLPTTITPIASTNNNDESKQIARIESPLAGFDPTSYLPSWFSKKDIFNKVAENAVNSFNSVLITLDPQMKEIRLAGGPSILVTSTHPFDICSIRDGFLDTFKRATVKDIDHFSTVETAAQIVGFQTAHKISLERVKGLRSNISIVPQNQIIISIENFLYNFDERWFDSDYLLLDDPLNKIQLSVHTQGTPIEDKYIELLKSKASNSKFKDDGFSIRIDNLIANDLNCSIGEWHKKYVGFEKNHYSATLLLSNLYKNKLREIGRLNE